MANSENFTHPQSRFQTILLNKQNCSLPSLQSTILNMHRTLLLDAVDKYWRRFPKRLKIFTIHGVNFFQFFCREANNLCLDINIWFLLEPSHHRTNVVELYWNPGLIHKCDYWKFQKYSTIFFPSGSVKDGPPKALDTPDIIWNTAGLGSSHNKLLSRYSHFSGRCLR